MVQHSRQPGQGKDAIHRGASIVSRLRVFVYVSGSSPRSSSAGGRPSRLRTIISASASSAAESAPQPARPTATTRAPNPPPPNPLPPRSLRSRSSAPVFYRPPALRWGRARATPRCLLSPPPHSAPAPIGGCGKPAAGRRRRGPFEAARAAPARQAREVGAGSAAAGGEDGGRVIGWGTPEEVSRTRGSFTGQFLRKELNGRGREG